MPALQPVSHAGEIALSGQSLERFVKEEARARGLLLVPYRRHGEQCGDLLAPGLLICNVPYRSIYGTRAHSEFVLQLGAHRVRIECRVQQVSGSVDEKFPYIFLSARDAMPETEIVILLEGSGARAAAVAWLRTACRQVTSKQIHVFTDHQAFRAWLKALIRTCHARAKEES